MEETVNIFSDLENQIEELSTLNAEQFYNTIQLLATMVSTRDNFHEGSHSRFVSQKSAEIARELGMQEYEIFEIETAALLHDIGKNGFKDTLMAKFESQMRDYELTHYYKHPLIGQKLLSKTSMFDNIGHIIAQHHERLNGSGFPYKLQGKEILPGAAIIAVVDTYHNVYAKKQKDKLSLSYENENLGNNDAYIEMTKSRFTSAMNFLHLKSGKLFDSVVVEIFTSLMEDERKRIGASTVMRLPINKIEIGWLIAEDYFSSIGLLIAARGEKMTSDIQKSLIRLAENREVPMKILVMKP
jgi:putative nucleotidyltransferase with HDIG domain